MAVSFITSLLQRPDAFGHQVTDLTCIETHISWVLLAGNAAYKFKKPLKLDFLDYSTLALRRAACEEELRLNRRTAPDLYLGLVAVVGTPQAPKVQPLSQLRGDASVLDWGVQMRRFAQDALLQYQVEQGTLKREAIDRLARQLADFHAQAAVAPPDGPWGDPAGICQIVAESFPPVLQAWADTPSTEEVRAVQRWSEVQGQQLAPRMTQRLIQGWVRECHGDLHLGNVVLLDGRPLLFDAIEFAPALRWIDVLAELAFLLMDLRAHGRNDLGWRLLNGYLEYTGDYADFALLGYYQCYRAMVRAKVAALRLAQLGGPDAAVQEQLARYVRLAHAYTQPREPVLWLVSGVSGSGKSSQTQTLIEQLGLVRIRSDVERKRLQGLPSLARSAAALSQGIYTAEATTRTYARLRDLARAVLRAGWPVLLDATFLRRSQRQPLIALARELGVPCRILALDAPGELLRQRVAARSARGDDPSEANLTVLEHQLQQREPLSSEEEALAVRIDTRQPVDWAAVLPPAWWRPDGADEAQPLR